ncbi:AAEL000389-PA, partial [Aedes aegypti]
MEFYSFVLSDKVVCYYGSWATYRVSNGKYDVEDINPNLCTHIIYTFVGLDASNSLVKILDPWNDVTLQAFKRFVGLKSKNANVKLLLAVGGWNEGSSAYAAMASSAVSRKAFIESVVSLLKTYSFDGFDVDWEYPTLRGGLPEDRVNFIELLKELRMRFDKEGYLLSIAVAATKDYHRSAYDVPEINKYVDFVNLMSYDLHAYWDAKTGHNSPLYAASWETDSFTNLLNVDACVRGWLDDGLAASKLIMGVPAFGHTFTLASSTSNGVNARTVGGGTAGPYTLETGTLSYLEICERLKTGYTKKWDDVQKVPFAYLNNQWISYDDVTSIGLKVAYAKSKSLGGVMVWSIESDDDRNICGEGAYPITSAVYKAVFGSSGTTTTVAPTTTTTPPGSPLRRQPPKLLRQQRLELLRRQLPKLPQRQLLHPSLRQYSASTIPMQLVCYLGSWASYRAGNGKFVVEDINPKLCTHIIYSFVGLDSTTYTVKHLDTYNDIDLQAFQRFIGLKSRNPNVKLMVAIGGWNEGSINYSNMAASATYRKKFIDSVVSFLQTYKFDGFDVDWEYPTQNGGSVTADRANFVTLLKELQLRFSSLGYILSIAVGASTALRPTAYNVPEINKYVDFVNLMTYDFHTLWDGRTGHNSPLYAASWEGSTSTLNVDAAIRGWLGDGLAASKLIMGIPVYAQTFTLASSGSNGVGASTIGGGTAGPYSQQAGMLTYLEVCERLKTGFTKVWDDVQKVPYAFSGNQWISYDDVTSIGLKVAYAKSKGLGGVMMWSIESDDDQDVCGGGAYPIV